MKQIHLSALAVLTLLCGCSRSTSDRPSETSQPVEKCPIHNVTFREGPGKRPDGTIFNWVKEMRDAMEKYPHVRHDAGESKTVQFCESCETEVDKVMEPEKRDSQPEINAHAPGVSPGVHTNPPHPALRLRGS